MRRTPQLMSYPTPPGLTTPSFSSVAATPPTGNPYPSCPSGSTTTCPTMPGSDATLAACPSVLSEDILAARASPAYTRTGTRMPSRGSILYSNFPALSTARRAGRQA